LPSWSPASRPRTFMASGIPDPPLAGRSCDQKAGPKTPRLRKGESLRPGPRGCCLDRPRPAGRARAGRPTYLPSRRGTSTHRHRHEMVRRDAGGVAARRSEERHCQPLVSTAAGISEIPAPPRLRIEYNGTHPRGPPAPVNCPLKESPFWSGRCAASSFPKTRRCSEVPPCP
jgi:hypothetical protein